MIFIYLAPASHPPNLCPWYSILTTHQQKYINDQNVRSFSQKLQYLLILFTPHIPCLLPCATLDKRFSIRLKFGVSTIRRHCQHGHSTKNVDPPSATNMHKLSGVKDCPVYLQRDKIDLDCYLFRLNLLNNIIRIEKSGKDGESGKSGKWQ